MRRNTTFGARKHASSHEHDGADPISSIGDADADTYIDTDTVGDGSGDTVSLYCNGTLAYQWTSTFAASRQSLLVNQGASTEILRLLGDSVSAATAPSRGVVSRDNICFAWGRVTVDITGNTATLNEGHNVDAVTWVTDQAVDVVYHNAASGALAAVSANIGTRVHYVYRTAPATTGFRLNIDSAPGGNYQIDFVVFTKDIT